MFGLKFEEYNEIIQSYGSIMFLKIYLVYALTDFQQLISMYYYIHEMQSAMLQILLYLDASFRGHYQICYNPFKHTNRNSMLFAVITLEMNKDFKYFYYYKVI